MRYRLDTENREHKMNQAREVLDIDKERWRADVIDTGLTHLIESEANINAAREDHDPRVIQEFANTSVLGLHCRTETRDKWR
ncbi:MAG: hypothetical protein ABEH88_12240 [Halobacteriales archaeon]